MTLASALTKQFDATWVEGDAAGGLDTGTFTFTVDDLNCAPLSYNPSLNVMTSNSISNQGLNKAGLSDRVENTIVSIPAEFQLYQNYPNPFNPLTTIRYHLAENESVRLEIYNLRGQLIRTLVASEQEAGEHSVLWDAKDKWDQIVASGTYIYRLYTGEKVSSNKMFLLK